MEIEPRHVFFFVFLAVTLTIMGGIADGVISGPDTGVVHNLLHGDLGAKIGATLDLLNVSYDWMNDWLEWPFRLINWVMIILIARQLWKLVPVIGR